MLPKSEAWGFSTSNTPASKQPAIGLSRRRITTPTSQTDEAGAGRVLFVHGWSGHGSLFRCRDGSLAGCSTSGSPASGGSASNPPRLRLVRLRIRGRRLRSRRGFMGFQRWFQLFGWIGNGYARRELCIHYLKESVNGRRPRIAVSADEIMDHSRSYLMHGDLYGLRCDIGSLVVRLEDSARFKVVTSDGHFITLGGRAKASVTMGRAFDRLKVDLRISSQPRWLRFRLRWMRRARPAQRAITTRASAFFVSVHALYSHVTG